LEYSGGAKKNVHRVGSILLIFIMYLTSSFNGGSNSKTEDLTSPEGLPRVAVRSIFISSMLQVIITFKSSRYTLVKSMLSYLSREYIGHRLSD